MSLWLKQSTSIEIKVGVFVDSVDGVTAETGLTITSSEVLLAKNEGDWAAKNESTSLVHESNGWYRCLLNTTDTNTLGILRLQIAESGALPVWAEYMVLPANVYDSLLSTDLLQVDVTQWLGVAPLALSSQLVQTIAAGLGSGSINNAAFATDTGLKPIRADVCTGGASGSITLDVGASSTTDFYKGARIYLTGGTGAGQSRLCTAYNGTTKVASVEPNWVTNPANGVTSFAILPDGYTPSISTDGLAEINTQVDTALADYDGPTFAELDARTDAIEADTQDIQARLPAALVSGRVDASIGATQANAITDAGLDTGLDAYAAKVWVIKESTTADHYAVAFYKNGQRVTSGVTSPTIQVIKGSDGTDLIASTSLTEIGSTHRFKKDESTNKLVAGQVYFAVVSATIDGSTRSWDQQIGRDSV